ncbi:MAG: glycoside hydrolase family 9 protein, partial [Lentisphaeria bacterium]|nr:glycoside hydrolase family 9 protein [Lentisphaeria bacterium]
VYKNTLRLRKSDPEYQNEIPFSGEEVLELDYSKFNTPGTYYLYVSGVGRSMDFAIGSKAISEAFYIHARGLYHKRCGIAKAQPFTAWTAPACHPTVIRGRFPGNAEHYRKGKGEKEFGFFDRKGNRIDVKHFELIKQNPPYENETVSAPGGWHDAADYDRRPYHLRIVSDLATLYLMKPENFIDGQLNIPESGNGIPDILDEAAWGLKHLLAVQQADGAVGTWFETTGHPQPGEGLPDNESRIYYISAPCRNGTLEYAAAVSTLALAMKKAGAHKQAQIYQQSAEKAWNFASDPRNRHVAAYQYNGKVIFYREEKELNLEHLIRYAATRYLLSGDDNARQMLLQNSQAALQEFNKNFRKWSPLSWMMLSETGCENIASRYRKVILNNADKMISEQENAYPYRTLWYAHNAGWVHSMAWGNYHPLRRAMTLIAAHKLTGKEKYLDAAYLANDFHNGANPPGRSMTSGLGRVYPAVFLDLVSYADGIGEFVPGITPYGNTFGIDRNAVKLVYGKSAGKLPIFRRHVNLEFLSVPSSEYSVWETIAPAVVTTGYLLEKPHLPEQKWKNRRPADDFRKLPGYRALP